MTTSHEYLFRMTIKSKFYTIIESENATPAPPTKYRKPNVYYILMEGIFPTNLRHAFARFIRNKE